MDLDLESFFEIFFEESSELLADMEQLLLAFDLQAQNLDDCNAIFRVAHSIKGGAATFGLTEMTQVTHVMEGLLDRIRRGEVPMSEAHIDAFLKSKDVLSGLLEAQRDHVALDKVAADELLAILNHLSAEGVAEDIPAEPATYPPNDASAQSELTGHEETASLEAAVQSLENMPPPVKGVRYQIGLPELPEKDISALLSELALLGQVSPHTMENGHKALILDTEDNLEMIQIICSFIVEVDKLEIVALSTKAEPAPPAPAPAPAPSAAAALPASDKQAASNRPAAAQPSAATPRTTKPVGEEREASAKGGGDTGSIRVNLEKIDQLINLVGELVITQAMVDLHAIALDQNEHGTLVNHLTTMARNTHDLQETVMSIRMMPMESVFSRFPRMIRDLAGKLSKKVELELVGGATELDKGLIEKIIDPLTHLLRNSVDHGFEMPEERLAAGKPEAGRLTLSAAHASGNILIEVSDDGKGLNRKRILDKAKEKGIPVSDDMNDSAVWQLVFAPGFSTAEAVTDVSGRGVGMDVVKRNIVSMGGSVEIRSVEHQGTTVCISLPLTMAILEGMLIRSGTDEIYILPLSSVVESIKPKACDIHTVNESGVVLRVRDELLPVIPLYHLFGIEPVSTDITDGIVVVVQANGKKAALCVDELVGQQQVVVKNLESNYRKVPGVSGATILGNGRVSLILDIPGLLQHHASAVMAA